jgi:hypothetical protein
MRPTTLGQRNASPAGKNVALVSGVTHAPRVESGRGILRAVADDAEESPRDWMARTGEPAARDYRRLAP